MYELKTNTAVRIPVGPFVDPTDGKTAETSLVVTDISVQLYQTKTDGTAVVRAQFAPTSSGGNNDMALVASSTDGMYDLELTANQLNWLGNGRITFYDIDGALVHWIDVQVVNADYFNGKYGTSGDIWSKVLPGTYGATEAGHILADIKTKTDTIGGAGALAWTYTLTDEGTGDPIDGAEVWITTDSLGSNIVASGVTNTFGVVNFTLDAGSYFVWRKKAGWNFSPEPDTEIVS